MIQDGVAIVRHVTKDKIIPGPHCATVRWRSYPFAGLPFAIRWLLTRIVSTWPAVVFVVVDNDKKP